MEAIHEDRWDPVLHTTNGRVTFERVSSHYGIWPVLLLIERSDGDLPFTVGDFLGWAVRSIGDRVYILIIWLQGKPVGFLIATAPWELDPVVWIHWGYLEPRIRGRGLQIIKGSLSIIKDWALEMGCERVAFETGRPRAWKRLVGAHDDGRVRVEY